MAFERFNKKVKRIVGNKACPMASLANALILDAGLVYFVRIGYSLCECWRVCVDVIFFFLKLAILIHQPPRTKIGKERNFRAIETL